MSDPDISSPFRGPPRSSHLRQISNISTKTINSLAPNPSAQGDGSAAHDDLSNDEATQPKHIERICTLWVHDDNPPREDVIMNFSLFPKGSVRAGDLAEIVALRTNSDIRDFQDAIPKNPKDTGTGVSECPPAVAGAERRRSPSNALNLEDATNRSRQSKRYVFIAKDMGSEQRARQPNLQISLATHIANAFGFRNKSLVVVSPVDKCMNSASHVELAFKDLYLSRSDMWRLAISELSDKTIYEGQKILFLGTVKALVKNIFLRGQRVQSALFSANTKPIFRSESARYVLFIQMSKEMWDFDSEGTGQIMFNKVVNGFLPELFKRWTRMNARHLVSIILFTRVEYEEEPESWRMDNANAFRGNPGVQAETADRKPYRDFFRVVITEMASGEWTTILYQLKRQFTVFLRDILIQPSSRVNNPKDGLGSRESDTSPVRPEYVIAGYPSAAIHGNILEAINLGSSQFSHDYIDRDLIRTGISIVVITPGTGYFEVDYEMLKMTTETLVGNGIGIDLVCLSKMPLHSVPLFKYRSPRVRFSPESFTNGREADIGSPHQLKYGSYSSRTNLSPSKISEFAVSPGSSSNTTSKTEQDWSYAVPHWIDVSFWSTGISGLTLHQPQDHRWDHVTTRERRYDRKAFVPRCRMYELQMMGIMENEISNISIPYLHEDPFYNVPTQTSRIGVKQLGNAASTNATSSGLSTPTGPKTLAAARSLTPALPKTERDIYHRENRDAYKWMDEYDEWVFRSLPSVRAAIKEIKSKRAREGHQKLSQQLQDGGTFVYGTSIGEQGRNAPAGTAYFDRKMKERRPSPDRTSERKASTSSIASTTNTLKPPKLSRHINLGLRGFGVGTPKATASTELQTEHEKPGSILTRGFHTPSIITGSHKDSQILPFTKNGSTLPSQAGFLRSGLSPMIESNSGTGDNDKSPSRPIAIKSAVTSLEQAQHGRPKSFVGSVFDVSTKDRRESEKIDVLQAASMTKQAGPKIDIAAAAPAVPPTLSPTSALAPWMTVLNPSNPKNSNEETSSHFRRWQHVFPRPLRTSSVKWKSLCSPAAVPLTTEYFPTAEQLATEYHESPYSISQNDDDEPFESLKTREDLMRELISLRLSQGFQLVVGPAVAAAMGKSSSKIVDVFHKGFVAYDGAMVFMSMGNNIHQLLCVEKGQDVEVKRFVRKPSGATSLPVSYKARIRPLMGEEYVTLEVTFRPSLPDYNWNYVDSFIAGYEENLTENLRFWRARFVLIPVDQPANARRPLHSSSEDNEEEIRLEGIRRLTQMWQRHRYSPPEERQRHDSSSWSKKKDPNPLDIIYRTRDPSEVIAAELDALQLLDSEPNARRSQLFSESEPFSRSSVGISALAQAIQGEKGVKMQDRRWHLRLHYNCFIGAELTTWLQENFKDIEDRDQAVEFGNELMTKGLFQHVEKRHKFRDGNYFYQISSEFRSARPESRGGGWFGTKRSDKSVPSTPMSDASRDSPRHDLSRSGSTDDSSTTDSGVATPRTGPNGKKLKITLSKVLKYDTDHRRKSYRPELVTLHYDRLHNPDNCYHIRIDWMNVTAKLIEDAVTQWANLAEKYGLKLVEVPIAEACEITATRPFRAPVKVTLAVPPPCKQPVHYFDATSFSPHQHPDRYYYHKAIMRKFHFVLDLEAASSFPTDVDVEYSTGKPTYRYSQYIHRSGTVLAQITDENSFILLANRIYNNRSILAREQVRTERTDHHIDRYSAGTWGFTAPSNPVGSRTTNSDGLSSHSTPTARAIPDITGMSSTYTTPQRILKDFSAFCSDPKALSAFYEDVRTKPISPGQSMSSMPTLDMSVTNLGMPPSMVRGESPSPGLSASGSASRPGSVMVGREGREGREGSGSTQSSRASMGEAPPE